MSSSLPKHIFTGVVIPSKYLVEEYTWWERGEPSKALDEIGLFERLQVRIRDAEIMIRHCYTTKYPMTVSHLKEKEHHVGYVDRLWLDRDRNVLMGDFIFHETDDHSAELASQAREGWLVGLSLNARIPNRVHVEEFADPIKRATMSELVAKLCEPFINEISVCWRGDRDGSVIECLKDETYKVIKQITPRIAKVKDSVDQSNENSIMSYNQVPQQQQVTQQVPQQGIQQVPQQGMQQPGMQQPGIQQPGAPHQQSPAEAQQQNIAFQAQQLSKGDQFNLIDIANNGVSTSQLNDVIQPADVINKLASVDSRSNIWTTQEKTILLNEFQSSVNREKEREKENQQLKEALKAKDAQYAGEQRRKESSVFGTLFKQADVDAPDAYQALKDYESFAIGTDQFLSKTMPYLSVAAAYSGALKQQQQQQFTNNQQQQQQQQFTNSITPHNAALVNDLQSHLASKRGVAAAYGGSSHYNTLSSMEAPAAKRVDSGPHVSWAAANRGRFDDRVLSLFDNPSRDSDHALRQHQIATDKELKLHGFTTVRG